MLATRNIRGENYYVTCVTITKNLAKKYLLKFSQKIFVEIVNNNFIQYQLLERARGIQKVALL